MTVPVRAGADMRLLRAAVFSAVCVTLSAAGHAIASGGRIPPWALLAGWAGVLCFAAPLAGRERSLPGIAPALLGGELGLHCLFSLGQWCGSASGALPGAGGSASPSRAVMALAARLLCKDGGPRLTPESAARIVRQAGIDPSSATAHAMSGLPGMPPGAVGASGFGPHAAQGGAMSLGASFSPSMLVGHLAAAVVLGWLLRRGEAAVWRIVRLSVQTAAHLSALLPPTTALAAIRALALLAGQAGELSAAVRERRTDDGTAEPESVKLQHSVARRGPPAVALAA